MEFISHIDGLFILLITLGVVVGIGFGAVPGMTATMALAVCLPLTYAFDLSYGLALLLGLYVGGISGGMIPAVLLKIPGTPSSLTTTFDGYPMTLKGRANEALKIGIVSSLFGGLFSVVILFLFAPTLADLAIKFSYVEKFLIIFLALTVIASLSKNMLVGLFSGALGIMLSLVGTYDIAVGGNGSIRLIPEFLVYYLEDGFSLLPVLIGLFGLATIFEDAEKGVKKETASQNVHVKQQSKFSLKVFKGQWFNLIRSSSIGTFIGLLPGVGGSAASVLSYTQEKNFSKHPEKLGTGEPAGVIASEASNNGLTGGALIPLLSLGIPGDLTTAILIGAFTLQGLQVGPLFIGEHLDIWYLIVAALFIANIIMFVVMFSAIKYIAKVVFVPKYLLYPIIVMMCTVGAYTINYGIMMDVWTLFIFGIIGYVGMKIGLDIPSMLIGFILGRSAEIYFVKSLESFGTYTIFFTKSPIAMFLWVLIILSIGFSIYMSAKNTRQELAVIEGESDENTK